MYRGPACPDAIACIRGGSDAPQLCGEVRFYQEYGTVLVVADISGMPTCGGTGFFALHIHEGGSCGGESFARTGGHYNPKDMPHPNHAGDLPPLMRYGDRAFLAVRTDRFCVKEVIGKTVVIHDGPDDFRSQPAGNAGIKIACGVICKKFKPMHRYLKQISSQAVQGHSQKSVKKSICRCLNESGKPPFM